MPKDIFTSRDYLVCGKLDHLCDLLKFTDGWNRSVIDMISSIRSDCEAMERKLVSRKEEVEQLESIVRSNKLGEYTEAK